ncbi:unnamed protein product [Hyaloperonospora brassicae]|uniref:Mic1 domain-containing protein n=1 Tax=Hyaloperonospora brassicae TaxID=162125 RepID=A0AAV0V2S3_HYABA|nr:unnamed protein product [Hyaloperonospora brassicae]
MSDDGHLYLCGGVDYAGDSRHAWFDAAHQCMLMISASCVYMLPLGTSLDPVAGTTSAACASTIITMLYDFNEPATSCSRRGAVQQTHSRTPVMYLQLSADSQFLAVQRSDIEVQVLHRGTRTSYWLLCSSRAGNRILHKGVVWSARYAKTPGLQDLFLVTRFGLEHHRVSYKRHSCVLHKTVGFYTHNFWYASSHGVLLLSTGSRANEIVPFVMGGDKVEKLPKLVFATTVNKQDLRLVALYGRMYMVYSDACSMKLLVYLVGRTKVSCVRSMNLTVPPGTALEYSVVDNVLVCHSLDFNVSFFFDIKCDTDDPLSVPLPISLSPPCSSSNKSKTTPAQASKNTLNELYTSAFRVASKRDGHERCVESPSSSLTSILYARCARSETGVDLANFADDKRNLSSSLSSPSSSQLAKKTSARQHQCATVVEEMLVTDHEVAVPRFSQWRFYPPDLVQRSRLTNEVNQMEFRKLQLNLAGICRTCEYCREILPFLLRRGDRDLAKLLVLNVVRKHIVEQQAHLSSIVQLLSSVQTACGCEGRHKSKVGRKTASNASVLHPNDRAHSRSDECFSSRIAKERPAARNVSGSLICIQQTEFYRHVWKSILDDTNVATKSNLSVYIVEYIKSLRKREVQVKNITYLALAECFIATGEPAKLYQFVRHHVIADFAELAELMVQNGEAFPDLLQAGTDMYFRLNDRAAFLRTLLDHGQAEQAIAIAWQNIGSNSCNASALPGVAFFDSLVRPVTSSKQPRSSLQVTQMLGHLLLFLKVWDPAALECPSKTSLSRLASCATVPFPDEMILPSSRLTLRKAFGFEGSRK